MSSKPRVQHMSWVQRNHKDPDPNKAKPTPIHPPSHRKENLSSNQSSTYQVGVKEIKMGGDIL